MKSIASLKKIYYDNLLHLLNFDGKTTEQIAELTQRCQNIAEVKAFIDTVIEQEYRNCNIFDITGETKTKRKALTLQEALRAKNLVCKYIWGYSWEELKRKFKTEENIKKYISRNSILMRRLENGNNVAIYGGSNGPCGRTMIASIIIKEAIKMRLFTPGIVSHTYDWVDFQTLFKDLKDDTQEIADYRTADWLVVDNICFKEETPAQIAFRTNLLDPFFTFRLKNNLPTILVFQYDIRSKKEPLFKTLGIGISNIVHNQRVCRIPLNKRN